MTVNDWTLFNPIDLQKQWDRISDNDLDVIADDPTKLIVMVHKRYKLSMQEAELEVEDWEITNYDFDRQRLM